MGPSNIARFPLARTAGLGQELSSSGEPRSGIIALSARDVSSREPIRTTHWYCRKERAAFNLSNRLLLPDGMRGYLLYVGGFVLPDKSAAAQRVLANAKLFREVGYETIFLNYSTEVKKPWLTEYLGFKCFECPGEEWDSARADIDRVVEVMGCIDNLFAVVAYNYPALGLHRLQKICKSRGCKCIGDVTEWYSAMDVSLAKRLPKAIDIVWRMRLLNKKCDALIVISDYLERYYSGMVTLNLPPLVDSRDAKWPTAAGESESAISMVYAGSPSRTKERLDLICEAVAKLPENAAFKLIVVGVTEDQYRRIYSSAPPCSDRISFLGRLSHDETIQVVAKSTYAVIVRDDNRVTRAGFPSKFVESLACGTPVISNDNSCICKYIREDGCGWVVNADNLLDDLEAIVRKRPPVVSGDLFDFLNYVEPARDFFEEIGL